jgi:probable selenium-dependent hydroxylase accessory protein YqeC
MKRLLDVLALGERETICVVGAGGKTSLLRRLATEVTGRAGDSSRILVTTTTRMLVTELRSFGPLVVETDDRSLLRALTNESAQVVAAAGAILRGKALGLAPSQIDQVRDAETFDHLLIEADGARGKDVKAPRRGEPVLPASTTVVLAVAGLRACGHPLAALHAQAPEYLASTTGQQLGSRVTEDTYLRIVESYRRRCRELAPQAAFVPVLSQADTPERLELAIRLVARLSTFYERVAVTTALRSESAREVRC